MTSKSDSSWNSMPAMLMKDPGKPPAICVLPSLVLIVTSSLLVESIPYSTPVGSNAIATMHTPEDVPTREVTPVDVLMV